MENSLKRDINNNEIQKGNVFFSFSYSLGQEHHTSKPDGNFLAARLFYEALHSSKHSWRLAKEPIPAFLNYLLGVLIWRFGRLFPSLSRFKCFIRNQYLKKIAPTTNCLFVFDQYHHVSYLDTDLPVVVMWDSIYRELMDMKAYNVKKSSDERELLIALEKDAFRKIALTVFPSQTSLNNAKKYYDIDESKVAIIPYGANLPLAERQPNFLDLNCSTEGSVCKILFVNSHGGWHRKGGDIVEKILMSLNDQNINAELHVIGPYEGKAHPRVIVHGVLDRNIARENKLFRDTMADCHFLLLPSRGDFVPGIIREAHFFGLPTIGSQVGSIPEMIKEGVTGYTIFDYHPEIYAAKIISIFTDRKRYAQLRKSTLNSGGEFTWAKAAEKLNAAIEDIVQSNSKNDEPLKAKKTS